MNSFARIASALVAASITLAPLAAMADQKPDAKQLDERPAKAHGKHDKPVFPMKADDFRKMVEKRIEHIKTRVDRSMDKQNLPAPQRAEVNKAVESAVKDVHAAVDKVAADGVVTKDEAKQVKDLFDKLREQIKDKSPRAKAPKAKPKAA